MDEFFGQWKILVCVDRPLEFFAPESNRAEIQDALFYNAPQNVA